ncbi:MAG TPA: terminase family protein [Candidatus Binataceae bacterium]|nr:terminase family protein [Candidatus Binataceae bacterium]
MAAAGGCRLQYPNSQLGDEIENSHYIEGASSGYPEDDGLESLYPDKESLLPLIRADLVQYCLAMNPRWRPARHLLYLADRLMAAERRELTRLVITMPPQHGKSWTTSQHFPAWYLGRHPEHSLITAAYNETKALDFGLSVKDQVNDPLFRLVFPAFAVRRDSNSALKFTTEAGGSYFAVGRGGSATGRRADLFIVDDPYKDEEEVRSDAVRRQIRSWWSKVIYTRLAPDAIVIVIHTRWDEDDLIGWLLSEHAQEGWCVINLPAIADETDPLRRSAGEALWPERYSLEELEKRRVNDPLGFQALYQQRPAGAGARMFRREWLEGANMNCRYDPVRHPPAYRAMNKLMLVDPANSKSHSADYTSIWVLGLAADRNFYVLDMVRDRLSLTERGDAVLGLHRKWQFARGRSIVAYEDYGLQADIAYLNDRMARENYRFAIKEVGGRLSKADRIARLVALFEQGRILLPLALHRTNTDGVEEDLVRIFMEEEYANYLVGGGGCRHDDMLDALSRLFDIDPVWPGPSGGAEDSEELRRWREVRKGGRNGWMSA